MSSGSGSSIAAGGARVGTDSVGALGYTPSLASQYARYLSSGNTVDPGALYTIWGGANDLFAVQANPAQAQAIIGAAVTAHVGLVGALTQAGQCDDQVGGESGLAHSSLPRGYADYSPSFSDVIGGGTIVVDCGGMGEYK